MAAERLIYVHISFNDLTNNFHRKGIASNFTAQISLGALKVEESQVQLEEILLQPKLFHTEG